MKTKKPKPLALLKDIVMQLTPPQLNRVVGGQANDPETGDPPTRVKTSQTFSPRING